MHTRQKNRLSEDCFLLSLTCCVLLFSSVIVTLYFPKDINADALSYHYYSGAMMLSNRLDLDFFGASAQGYFNPLVHLPFAAMVQANWPDRAIAVVMACYSAIALMLMAMFYNLALDLKGGYFVAAVALSLSSLPVWACTGTSFPDLFLQIPVFASLLFLFVGKTRSQSWMICLSALCFGVALGMKLTAIMYIPGIALLLLLWMWKKEVDRSWIVLYPVIVAIGFVITYGWWGIKLYQQLGNPFFPFFNQWFHSPYFSSEAVTNKRFISWSILEQILLPFRIALSDILTYIEIRAPDIRPGIFVLSFIGFVLIQRVLKRKMTLNSNQENFLWFLMVSLYTWVFMSGNGRYGLGILLMVGAGLVIALRALFPLKITRSIILCVLIIQVFIMLMAGTFRYGATAWGGEWFNTDFGRVLGKGNQLVLTGTESSFSIIAKDMGSGSSLINVHGGNPLENNPLIQGKIDKFENNILGMVMAGLWQVSDAGWINETYFDEFGRFGLSVADYSKCDYVKRKELDGKILRAFLFCPLVKDAEAFRKYQAMTKEAHEYFTLIESICPDTFSPKQTAIIVSGKTIEKFYSNYELLVTMDTTEEVRAKKQWSMMIFPLGGLTETQSALPGNWREKYCIPLEKSKAITRE